MEPVTPLPPDPPARTQKSSHSRPLTKEQQEERAAVQRAYTPKLRFTPKPPYLQAGRRFPVKKSSIPLTKEQEEERAALQRAYTPKLRYTPMPPHLQAKDRPVSMNKKSVPLTKEQQEERAALQRAYTPELRVCPRLPSLQAAGIPLAVIQPSVLLSKMKPNNERVHTNPQRVTNWDQRGAGQHFLPESSANGSQVSDTAAGPQTITTVGDQPIQVQRALSKIEQPDSAAKATVKVATPSLSAATEPLIQHQSKAKRQVTVNRDNRQVPRNNTTSLEDEAHLQEPETCNFCYLLPEPELAPSSVGSEPQEPRTSSFRYPSEEPALAPRNAGSEPQEQDIRGDRVNISEPNVDGPAEDVACANMEILEENGEAEGENRASSERGSQREQLDDIDRMLLGLDNNVADNESPPTQSTLISSNSKRRRPTAHEESSEHDQFQVENAQDEVDEYFEVAAPRKRRWSNRKNPAKIAHSKVLGSLTSRRKSRFQETHSKAASKKPQPKKPQRLPVEELETIPEAFDHSDLVQSDDKFGQSVFPSSLSLEDTSLYLKSSFLAQPLISIDTTLELSQDPISQFSPEDSDSDRLRYQGIKERTTKRNRRGRIGLIDTKLFRIPDRSKSKIILQSPSYSDGFEGVEACPIGRLMPIKNTSCRKKSRYNTSIASIRLPELKIVAKRPIFPSNTSIVRRHRKKQRQSTRVQITEHVNNVPNLLPLESHQDINEVIHHEPEQIIEVERQDNQLQIVEHEQPDVEPQQDEQDEQLNVPQIEENQEHRLEAGISTPSGIFTHTLPSNPLTPRFLSGGEQSSEHGQSTTSPLERKLQSKLLDTIQVRKATEATQSLCEASTTARNCSNNPQSYSQLDIVTSTPRETPKQVKADTEAMHELSLVSVERREPESDNSEDRTSDEENGDGRHHKRDDSNWSDSDESYDDNGERNEVEDETYDEQKSDEELAETQMADRRLLGKNSRELDDDDSDLLPNSHTTEGTPNKRTDPPTMSLQDFTKYALRVSSSNHRSKLDLHLNPPSLLKGEVLLTEDQRLAAVANSALAFTSRYHEYPDNFWRPESSSSTAILAEVDEDTQESPQNSRRSSHASQAPDRRRSRFASRPLPLVHSCSNSPIPEISAADQYHNQESPILHDTQSQKSIPETQVSDGLEEHRFQMDEVPSYYLRASNGLSKSTSQSQLVRAESSQARLRLETNQTGQNTMSPSEMFWSKLSPEKSTQRHLTLLKEGRSPARSLNVLTRATSLGMGTLPVSSRSRRQSEAWKPPFLKGKGGAIRA